MIIDAHAACFTYHQVHEAIAVLTVLDDAMRLPDDDVREPSPPRRTFARWLLAAVTMVVLVSMAAPLHAQSRNESIRSASFTAGGSFGDGEAALALAAGLGFRFSPRVGMDFEAAYARQLDFTIDLCPAPLVCVIGGRVPVTGRTVSLVPHVVFEWLRPEHRLDAYIQLGAGAGHVRQRYSLGPPFTHNPDGSVEFTRSNVTVALSFGGGASMRISRRLRVSADVRSLHLRDEDARPGQFIRPSGTLSTLRIGARLGWQF